jgi:uncharacterized membrane protein
MKYPVFLLVTFLTACLVASLIGWSISAGSFIVPLVAIPLGVIVFLSCRQHVDGIRKDERVVGIRSMAALRTLEVCIILGAIGAVILYSFVISDHLSPTITGRYITNESGVTSMLLTLYRPGDPQIPENIIRSTIIPDINSMDEYEATEFCQFRRESFQDNEQKGLVGMTLGSVILAMLIIFGVFNLYYSRKY